MTNLEEIYLSSNQIKKIEELENLTKLERLFLNGNQISDITPLSVNTSLTTLDLRRNSEIDADRTHYTPKQLQALDEIGKILDKGGVINLDADKLNLFTNYKKLDLSSQNLSTLENLEGINKLTNLNLNNNKLTLEDTKSQEILKNMINLQNLNLANNQITNVKVLNNLKNLKLLYLNGKDNKINLVEIEDIISNLDLFSISTENLKTIVNCDINKITKLYIQSSGLLEIPDLSKFTLLNKLNLHDNPKISNFEEISKISSLQELILSSNNLHGRMIDFSKLINLTNLGLNNNFLNDADLENLKPLRNNTNLKIDLRNNSIINATALLEFNPNTKIDLTGNVNLSQEAKNKLKARFGNNVTF